MKTSPGAGQLGRVTPAPIQMTPQDAHTALSAFVGVMVAEVVVKPVATRLGRFLLGLLDQALGEKINFPSWLNHDD